VEPKDSGRSDYPRSENEIWDKNEVIKWDLLWSVKYEVKMEKWGIMM